MTEPYTYAIKLLQKRDYTVAELLKKVEARFEKIPTDLIDRLTFKNFLNDRRLAENYVVRRKERGRLALREELVHRGVAVELVEDVLSQLEWPSLRDALKAKMTDWKLRAPLQSRDAARLFRALNRLGFDEDAIREEVERLHEE